MPELEFEAKDKTKDSIVTPLGLGILLKMLYSTASGDAFGTPWACLNSAGDHYFASMPHGCVHRPRSPTMRLCRAVRHAPIIYTYAFAVFLRVSRMLYGTASGDQFGTPWARILLGFRCFASMPHGCVHRPRPPAMRYVPLSAMRLLYARFCFVFTGFEDAVRHRLWGPIWHALGSDSAGVPLFRNHASQTRSSAMSTFAPIRPAIRHAPIYPCFCPCFCCVFTGFEDAVRHRLWGSIWHALSSNSAGVPLFRKHASQTRSSAMSTFAPIRPAIRHAPIYPCFCPCFCCVFTGFEDAVRHRLWGPIWHALGSDSAGVPLFRKHASQTRSSAMSTFAPIRPAIRHALIYPCFCPCFCCVFTGFEDAVRHRLWGSIWHALSSNSAGVPLFRKQNCVFFISKILSTLTHTPPIEQQTTPQDRPPKTNPKSHTHNQQMTPQNAPCPTVPPSKKSNLFFFCSFFFSCLRFPWNLGSAAWAVALLLFILNVSGCWYPVAFDLGQ